MRKKKDKRWKRLFYLLLLKGLRLQIVEPVYGDKCKRHSYGEIKCVKCGGVAHSHVYDAAHSPWPIYGYENHCHSCGIFFEDADDLKEQVTYIKALRDGKSFVEALEAR